MRRERLAIAALILILVGLPLITLGYQRVLRPALSGTRVIDIRAAVPESGGFQPDSIRVAAGETVTLRYRDSMQQERLSSTQLKEKLSSQLSLSHLLTKL